MSQVAQAHYIEITALYAMESVYERFLLMSCDASEKRTSAFSYA